MFYVGSFISHLTLKRFVTFLHTEFSGDALYLYINSHGGCTRSALAIYEILRVLSDEKGIKIITQILDECSSAAVVLFLAGDERYATSYSSFLIHEVSVEESKRKQADGYKTTADELEKETYIIFDLIKSRTKLTLAMIKKKVKNAKDNDWIFDVDEAMKVNIVTHAGFYMPESKVELGEEST
jgi:ATP-dependent Clp protease protease subunit